MTQGHTMMIAGLRVDIGYPGEEFILGSYGPPPPTHPQDPRDPQEGPGARYMAIQTGPGP
jgi:hypothetical protein